MTCAISWGRCSLIGFLVMSVVVVLVLLFISFPVDGGWCLCVWRCACKPSGIPNAHNHTVKNFIVVILA